MNRLKKGIAVSCLLSLAVAAIAPSALAFRSSVGAVSGHKKLIEGMGNGKNDLEFSPLLLEMAKLIGRTGLPPGFFLQNDPNFPESPGVDLRTLLLFQAGLIKMPIRLITGQRKETAPNGVPMLMLPSIPEPRKAMSSETPLEFPSLASTPLPRDPEQTQVVEPKMNIGSPDRIRIADAVKDDRAQIAPEQHISIDVSKLQAELKVFGDEQPAAPVLNADVPLLAMAMPRTNAMPYITQNAFRLWTFRSDSKSEQINTVPASPEYTGTFVVATTGAIKSITGRHFVLSSGKLLASNQGGELLFKTPLGQVSVELNATAVVEILQQNGESVVKVYPLETPQGSSVSVDVSGTKPEHFQLKAGEALVISQSKATAPSTTARVPFRVKDFVDKELIVRPEVSSVDAEEFSALSSLKKRVTDR